MMSSGREGSGTVFVNTRTPLDGASNGMTETWGGGWSHQCLDAHNATSPAEMLP